MSLLAHESLRCARCKIRNHLSSESRVIESMLSPTRVPLRCVKYGTIVQKSRTQSLNRISGSSPTSIHCRLAASSTLSSVENTSKSHDSYDQLPIENNYYTLLNRKIYQVLSRHKHTLSTDDVKQVIRDGIDDNLKNLNKIVNELNLEVPKSYQQFCKLLKPSAAEKQILLENVANNTVNTPLNSDMEGAQCNTDASDLSNLKLPVYMRGSNIKGRRQVIRREQHSFAEAMENTLESLRPPNKEPASVEPNIKQLNIIKAIVTAQSKSKKNEKTHIEDNKKPARTWKTMIPNYSVPFLNQKKSNSNTNKKDKKLTVIDLPATLAEDVIDRKTHAILIGLKQCKSDTSRLVRLEEFCNHILVYPSARKVALQNGAISLLLKFRSSTDQALSEQSLEGLALMGHVDPVKGRGIRILSLDGGGTRGLATIELMQHLEKTSGKRIYDMFDYICGVSTGALIAIMVGVFKVPLDECSQIYGEFARDMFSQTRLEGAKQLVMSHAYYNTKLWEDILQENIGNKSFLDIVRDPTCPKISVVSNLVNQMSIENFMFRNYTHPVGSQSHYPGSIQHKLWQAIRASSAAPGYYEEFKLDGKVHQDGGLLTNNPAALAIHECRLLWPNTPIQSVVSLGTGRYSKPQPTKAEFSSLKNKLIKVVQSATETESVHHILMDLLPANTYYRFNPPLSDDFQMDEILQEKWDQMIKDTREFCTENKSQLQKASEQLLLPKRTDQKVVDWASQTRNKVWP